jgi:glutamyl/glutaminyl-tRNA synthetase
MSAAELRPLVAPRIGGDAPWIEEAIEVVKKSVHRLTQFADALLFLFNYEPPAIDRAFAEALAAELREHGAPADSDSYNTMVARLKAATGLKGKELFMPLRLAMTGMDHGPELVRAIPLLRRASETDARVLSPLARVERCIT